MLTNGEIVQRYLNSGLIEKCVECQFAKVKNKSNKEDFFQDLILILLEYDNKKLNNAHEHKHMNALITRIIVNNIFSKTSPYYKKYGKYASRAEEITNEMIETIADEED